MTGSEHSRILAIGFGVFAAIFAFTMLLLMVVSFGVFAALGITSANETGSGHEAGIGVIGGVVAVIFYGFLGVIFVLPMALAGWKIFKRRPNARIWGIIAAILVVSIFPLGTMLGVYALWFFVSAEGRRLYLSE